MLTINVEADMGNFLKKLDAIEREQLPYATARALSTTIEAVRDGLVAEMKEVFRNPVPYTLNALYLRRATKQILLATVGVKNQSGGRISPLHWLLTEIQGGNRNVKALERAFSAHGILPTDWTVVPAGGAKLDSYGNVSGGQINQILSQVKAAVSTGSTTLRRLRRGVSSASPYFVVMPGDRMAERLPPGIYQRSGHTSRRAVFIFVPRRPNYRSRFDFYKTAERIAREKFPDVFRQAMRDAVASA